MRAAARLLVTPCLDDSTRRWRSRPCAPLWQAGDRRQVASITPTAGANTRPRPIGERWMWQACAAVKLH